MDISQLLTLSNLILCLAVVALTEVIKHVVVFFLPTANKSNNGFAARLWKQVALPIVPTLLGGVIGYVSNTGFLLGLAMGLLSTTVYRMVRKGIGK